VKEATHYKQVMTARLDWSSMMVGAVSSGTPAPRLASTVAARAGAPPPSAESTREAFVRRIDDRGLLGGNFSVLG
jgi:hypothetical protein